MARSVTLAEIRTRAMDRCDMLVDAAGDGYVDTAAWSRLIDAAYTELYDLLVSSGLYYFESTATVTATGAATYALPADHYQTIGVDYVRGSDSVALELIGARGRNRYRATGSRAYAYRVVGATIALYPSPASGQTYLLTYVPAPASLVDAVDATTIDGVSGWEEFLVVVAAKKARIREESDVSALVAEENQLRQRIAEMAEQREAAEPRVIHDVYEGRGDLDSAPWPGFVLVD